MAQNIRYITLRDYIREVARKGLEAISHYAAYLEVRLTIYMVAVVYPNDPMRRIQIYHDEAPWLLEYVEHHYAQMLLRLEAGEEVVSVTIELFGDEVSFVPITIPQSHTSQETQHRIQHHASRCMAGYLSKCSPAPLS